MQHPSAQVVWLCAGTMIMTIGPMNNKHSSNHTWFGCFLFLIILFRFLSVQLTAASSWLGSIVCCTIFSAQLWAADILALSSQPPICVIKTFVSAIRFSIFFILFFGWSSLTRRSFIGRFLQMYSNYIKMYHFYVFSRIVFILCRSAKPCSVYS